MHCARNEHARLLVSQSVDWLWLQNTSQERHRLDSTPTWYTSRSSHGPHQLSPLSLANNGPFIRELRSGSSKFSTITAVNRLVATYAQVWRALIRAIRPILFSAIDFERASRPLLLLVARGTCKGLLVCVLSDRAASRIGLANRPRQMSLTDGQPFFFAFHVE